MTVIKKLLFVFVVFVLASNLGLGRSKMISDIISVETYEGDLILNGNNVTVIEGYFEINGSIYVSENATLILHNAIVNFTVFNSGIFMENPANGNPRLQAENTEIIDAYSNFYDNASAKFSNLTGNSYFQFYDETTGSFTDSTFDGLSTRYYSTITVANSTLQYLDIILLNGNASVIDVYPGFVDHWDFQENCSVTLTPQTEAPELIINQTTVDTWSFSFQGSSNATVTNSKLSLLHANQHANVKTYDSIIDTVEIYHTSTAKLTNVTYLQLRPFGDATVYVYWYLHVQVLDSSAPGYGVQSTNVTATFPNGTMADQALTGSDGWTRLTLMEKMTNATSDYPAETYTVKAAYSSYSNSTPFTIFGNQEITLTLEGFVISEFQSFLLPLLMAASIVAVIMLRRRTTRPKKHLLSSMHPNALIFI